MWILLETFDHYTLYNFQRPNMTEGDEVWPIGLNSETKNIYTCLISTPWCALGEGEGRVRDFVIIPSDQV